MMYNSGKELSESMESPECSELCRLTPESTSGPPNDSGYFTATPSPLSEVSDIASGGLSSSNINFIETPVVTKKGTSRKKLLKKTLPKHSGEECGTIEENEVTDQRVPKDCEAKKSDDPMLSGEGSLLDSFCGLHVEESDTEQSNNVAPMSSIKNLSPGFDSSGGQFSPLLNPKKSKYKFPLGDRLFAKRFKSNEAELSPCSQSISGNRRYNLIGVRKLDFFIHLGEFNSFPGVLSLILSFLPPKDLVNVCKVSHAWRKICVADPAANQRRLAFLRNIKQTKENISWNDFKQADQGLLPLQKEVFRDIQNVDHRASSSSSPSTPRSPPVSPSKVRFHRFFKVGGTLGEGAQLLPCPRCSWPSCAEPGLQQARCQSVGCQYNFCLKCHCDAHPGKSCVARTAAGQPRRSKATCVGSKQSRRNLRRL